jgi:hypothetical protein
VLDYDARGAWHGEVDTDLLSVVRRQLTRSLSRSLSLARDCVQRRLIAKHRFLRALVNVIEKEPNKTGHTSHKVLLTPTDGVVVNSALPTGLLQVLFSRWWRSRYPLRPIHGV